MRLPFTVDEREDDDMPPFGTPPYEQPAQPYTMTIHFDAPSRYAAELTLVAIQTVFEMMDEQIKSVSTDCNF